MATRVLTACAGFLFAVLWFDLMFDVQVIGQSAQEPLPAPALASISSYYRRVTTDASPMGHLVGAVMLIGVVASLVQARQREGGFLRRVIPVILIAAPAALALGRVLPDAVRLGAASDPAPIQSELARAILLGHLACLASITGLLLLQLRRID